MVESGAVPRVSFLRKTVSKVGQVLTSPLMPDDYFALVHPDLSTRELTGTVVRTRSEPGGATTVVVKPNFAMEPHIPGQYLRIGIEIDGIRHWRAYSLTSDPKHPDGYVSVTVKKVDEGKVSPFFNDRLRSGQRVWLGDVEGEFVLPTPLPDRMLFVSAGSGITPVMSMLRELDRRGELTDREHEIVHVHSARTKDEMIFGDMLRDLAETRDGYRLIEVHTAHEDRLSPDDLDRHYPQWREAHTFLSGPPELIDAMEERFEQEDLSDRLHLERFQPVIGNGGGDGSGGTVHYRISDAEAECGPGVSILVGGEEAGLDLQYGCRMGICHTCVGRLQDGAVRDIRTGGIEKANGQMIRVCVSAPEGHVEIDL